MCYTCGDLWSLETWYIKRLDSIIARTDIPVPYLTYSSQMVSLVKALQMIDWIFLLLLVDILITTPTGLNQSLKAPVGSDFLLDVNTSRQNVKEGQTKEWLMKESYNVSWFLLSLYHEFFSKITFLRTVMYVWFVLCYSRAHRISKSAEFTNTSKWKQVKSKIPWSVSLFSTKSQISAYTPYPKIAKFWNHKNLGIFF